MNLRAAWSALWQRTERRDITWDLLRAGHAGWGIADASGQLVTHKSAEHGLAAVGACVSVISGAIGSLPALVYRWEGDRRVEAPTHPLQRLIDRGPNRHQSWPDWLEWTVAEVLLRGNAVSEIRTDARGAVVELVPISWDRISIVDLPGDMLGLDVVDPPGQAGGRGGTRRLLEPEVFWLKDRTDDGAIGVSRLHRAAGVVGTQQALAEFSASMWRHGTHPSGALQTDSVLTETARSNLARHMKEFHSGPGNAARFLLLEAGLKWQTLVVSPEDAELLESRKFSVAEICRVFGVPPPLVQDYSHNTFTNSQEASRWFASNTLTPWVVKLQAEAKRSLFSAAAAVAHELVLDMSDLLRGSPLERWQANKLAIEAGVLDPDEIRTAEGYPPREASAPAPTPKPNGADLTASVQ